MADLVLGPAGDLKCALSVAPVRSIMVNRDAIIGIDADQWAHLSSRAFVDNPFYARRFMLAGLRTVDTGRSINAFVVRDSLGAVCGLFPITRLWGAAVGAGNKYQNSGTPLIRQDKTELVVGEWLAAMAAGRVPAVWILRDIHLDGDFASMVTRMAGSHDLRVDKVRRYSRPRLTRLPGGLAQHLDEVISKARRKDIERSIRRLGEQGTLEFEHADDPVTVSRRLEQFLEMEHAGWKGQSGTAFLCHPDTADFARAAYSTSQYDRFTSTDSLLLNGEPIAVSLNISTGRTTFTPKCAYDERFRKWSPGLVLEYRIVQYFYESDHANVMDSAATVDGHVVEGLWPESVEHGDLVIGLPPAVFAARTILNAYGHFKSTAKGALGHGLKLKERLRGLLTSDGAASKDQP